MAIAQMKLVSFRVTNFRSVRDSGWIDASDVTALIGTNEAGKTNLLVPLWKLKPAKEGEIKLITDAPRKDFHTYRQMAKKPVFITARFQLSEVLAKKIAALTGEQLDKVRVAEVARDLGGSYTVHFPDAPPAHTFPKTEVQKTLDTAKIELDTLQPVSEPDTALKTIALSTLDSMRTELAGMPEAVGHPQLTRIKASLAVIKTDGVPPESMISPRLKQLSKTIDGFLQKIGKPTANDSVESRKLVQDNLPVFVYYTTYGNLDSEIYLPHVIEDLKRTDLTGRTEARARTLRVLFDFVRLKPEEILELGRDVNESAGRANDEQIRQHAERKKERSVLLQSASTELTEKFREWWKQGEYRLRFEADGNHFRIWVSDDKRPEEIELEGRSTGLQWFLSFYLIFLVESKAAHSGAILILDEPGHTLHPLAQRDLSLFFENLAKTNQLLYTSHSPFLIDADHLDRVRAVYVDEKGYTIASSNLRAGQPSAQSRSIYPVHAALGLSVSDTLFQGCQAVVVEGQADQLYLSCMKTLLVNGGQVTPNRDLLFVPTSGAKAIKTVASILSATDDKLPVVLCDGDQAGRTLASTLKQGFYESQADRVLLVTDFLSLPDAEIEDMFPKSFMADIVDRYLKGPADAPFRAVDGTAFIPQAKNYAQTHGIALNEGWKVEIARIVKTRVTSDLLNEPHWRSVVDAWNKLFDRLVAPTTIVAVPTP